MLRIDIIRNILQEDQKKKKKKNKKKKEIGKEAV